MIININVNRIRGIMAEKRITGDKLAKLTGFSRTTISNFLNDKTPTLELVVFVSKALGLTPNEIVEIFFDKDIILTHGGKNDERI